MSLKLANIPDPFLNESLASWIQRICQIYDLTFNNFQKTVGITGNDDLDLCFTREELVKFIDICDVNPNRVEHIQTIFCRLSEQPNLQTLMLSEPIDGYIYRFCPTCWAEDHTPYMRFEWRFRTSEFCFKHHTDLLSRCPFCENPIPMHKTILGGSVFPPPVAHLAQCHYCRADLRFTQIPIEFSALAMQQLMAKIDLQKSIASALLHNYFYVADKSEKFPLSLLALLLDGSAHHVLEPASKLYNLYKKNKILVIKRALIASYSSSWIRTKHPAHNRLIQKSIMLWRKLKQSP